jgi:hypothetical protein
MSLSLLERFFHGKNFVLPPMMYTKGYKVSNKCSTWSRNLIYIRSNGANLLGSVLKSHLNIKCPREQIHFKSKRPYYIILQKLPFTENYNLPNFVKLHYTLYDCNVGVSSNPLVHMSNRLMLFRK